MHMHLISQRIPVPSKNFPNQLQVWNDVLKRINNDSSKYGGYSIDCWTRYFESFIRMAWELELTKIRDMKIRFFHHSLCDQALEYLIDSIENKFTTFPT